MKDQINSIPLKPMGMSANISDRICLRLPLRTGVQASSSSRVQTLSRYARWYPLWFFQLYLLGSILVFAGGPVEFDVDNAFYLYSYVLAGQIAIAVGYWLGIGKSVTKYCGWFSISAVIKATILTTLLISPLTLIDRNQSAGSLTEAITNPGAAYAERAERLMDQDSAPIIAILRALSGPLLGLFMPLGVIYYGRQSGNWRTLWKLGLVALLCEPLFLGVAKGLFEFILLMPWIMWMRRNVRTAHFGVVARKNPARQRKRPWSLAKKFWIALLGVGVTTVVLFYFSYSRQSRYGLTGSDYPPWTTGWSKDLYGIALPQSVEYPTFMICRYWTQGYFGLAECLKLDFEWDYGIGHSKFLMRYLGTLGSDPDYLLNRCYPYRLDAETGYSATNYWHTIYPWLASDLTFPGAILCVGLFGYLLARSWKETLWGENPFAAGFLCQMLLLFYYVPANNARLMFSEEAIAFWGLFFLWTITSQRRSLR